MGAPLDDPSLVQHDDLVGIAHGGEPVGDHQHGPVLHQAIDRLLDQSLRFGVEGAGGLVEDQDRRVAQQCPGDRDPLALSAGQTGAPLAQDGVVPLGELTDELGRVRRLGRGLDLLAGGVGRAVGDVGVNTVSLRSTVSWLTTPMSARSERRLEPGERHAVEQDPTLGRIVETRQQVGERRLPRPGGPDERDHFALGNREARCRSSTGSPSP